MQGGVGGVVVRNSTRKSRLAAMFLLVAVFGFTACGGGDGGGESAEGEYEGTVVSVGTTQPLSDLSSGEATDLTVSSLIVDLGDEVPEGGAFEDGEVEAAVASGDQARVAQLFTDGDLGEGDQVTIEWIGTASGVSSSGWLVVNVAGIELSGESEAPSESEPSSETPEAETGDATGTESSSGGDSNSGSSSEQKFLEAVYARTPNVPTAVTDENLLETGRATCESKGGEGFPFPDEWRQESTGGFDTVELFEFLVVIGEEADAYLC